MRDECARWLGTSRAPIVTPEPIMMRRSSRLVLAAALIGLAGVQGCGVDESKFSETPGSVPPDAPKTPEEYDQRYPLQDKGGREASP